MIRITVYGNPAPQGSKSFKGMSNAGHAILVESSKAVKPWRMDVKAAAMLVTGSGPRPTISGPVSVKMIFTIKKPASAPKTKMTWPDRMPDLSKLVRSTEDALTEMLVWEDDARVVELITAKRYPLEGDGALSSPGAIIEIRSIKESLYE